MKKVVFVLMFLSFAFAKAQTYSSKIIPNNTMLLHGYIGKYPITMYIEKIGYCEYQQEFTGWYKYGNSQETIPILFYYSSYPEEEGFKIFAKYDGDFETEVTDDYACQVTSYDEVFETSAENGIFNGLKWRKTDSTGGLEVNFLSNPQDKFWELGTQQVYLTNKGSIILDLGALDDYFSYAYAVDIIGHEEVSDENHLLMEISVPSKPGGNGRGMCGGGEEIYILYLKLDANNKLLNSDNAHIYSCFQEIPEDAFSYDAVFPENGIKRNSKQ
ncbi:hypothetical protein LX97_02506 [Nonlabens dokdonensis]|nr:hypothetical protein LX97_02506 [Nonlabens dokdonensis]